MLKELDRLAPKYPAAMADTSRWRLAKRVFTAVLEDGISLGSDPAVLDAWAQRFSACDAEGRQGYPRARGESWTSWLGSSRTRSS